MSQDFVQGVSSQPFLCSGRKGTPSSCTGEPFYRVREGNQYCALHYPGEGKDKAFDESFSRKYSRRDWNFSGVWFPKEARFLISTFEADVDFSHATFNAEADFRTTTFKGRANFREVLFRARVDFGGTNFHQDAIFYGTTFDCEADFRWASFHYGANFEEATFRDLVRFTAGPGDRGFLENCTLNLQHARIERPERFSFHEVSLRPEWFVNVDPRSFQFVAVKSISHYQGCFGSEVVRLLFALDRRIDEIAGTAKWIK